MGAGGGVAYISSMLWVSYRTGARTGAGAAYMSSAPCVSARCLRCSGSAVAYMPSISCVSYRPCERKDAGGGVAYRSSMSCVSRLSDILVNEGRGVVSPSDSDLSSRCWRTSCRTGGPCNRPASRRLDEIARKSGIFSFPFITYGIRGGLRRKVGDVAISGKGEAEGDVEGGTDDVYWHVPSEAGVDKRDDP